MFFDADPEELSNATHFPFEIRRKVRIVNKQQVRPLSFSPVADLSIEEERVGRSLDESQGHSRPDPPPEELHRVGRRLLIGTADDGITPADRIKHRNLRLLEAGEVIVHGQGGSAAIPADVNVFDMVVKRQSIDRQMSL